jgi:hypothetical protein
MIRFDRSTRPKCHRPWGSRDQLQSAKSSGSGGAIVRRIQTALVAVALGACGSPYGFTLTDSANQTGDASDSAPLAHDAAPVPDSTPPPPSVDSTIVYAHADSVLYRVDPRSSAFSMVGNFGFPNDGNSHTMTDFAVDAMGDAVAVTQNALYRVDVSTAQLSLLAPLPGSHLFVGLTYLPAGALDPLNEVLVGGCTDGTYWRIDPGTGASTQLGQFQGGWQLSGDIVSIAGAATYATVRQSSTSNDSLATLNPSTGELTIIGDTGFHSIFGLGYWRSTLFGFTRSGQFITIDATTGHGTLVAQPVRQFSGAGVTTIAPITPG